MELSHSLPYYRKLLSSSLPIVQNIFPKKMISRYQLSKYLALPAISSNIKVPGKVPINSFNRSILNPGWSMIERGGKQWRPLLGLICSKIFINDLENMKKHKGLYELLYISDLVHNASLIIDDIEDKSIMRRGKKCVHLLYGEDVSINAGFSMMIFPMNYYLSQLNNKVVKGILAENFLNELTSIHLGQGWDIEMKCNCLPEIQTYIDTVLCKTGVCPRLIIKMAKVYIEQILKIKTGLFFNEMLELCDDLSVAFQIWDDLMNLRPSTVSKNKNKIGEDITEGKLTIMVLHSLRGNFANKERLKKILTMGTKDQELINEAIWIMKKNGSIKYSEMKKDQYVKLFEKKCHRIIKGKIDIPNKSNLNLKAMKALIELKNTLIKV